MLKTDVIIVTSRGRHDWICEELSRMGLNAIVLDLTEALGPWAPEDWEGPFGLFKSERLLDSQLRVLSYDADIHDHQEGFCLWTKNGPLELKGPLSSYQLSQTELDPIVKDYISASEHTYHQTLLENEREVLMKLEYKNSWLAHLAHSFASPQDLFFPESLASGHGLPLFSPYANRRPQRRSTDQAKKRLETHGHFYHPIKKITSIGTSSRKIQYIESETILSDNQSSKVQKFEANYFIWNLSRVESEFVAAQNGWTKEIFSTPAEEPLWTWSRFRFHFKPSRLLENIPRAVCIVNDLFLSWTHDNFFVVNKTDNTSDAIWDVWIKLAFHRRAEKEYLKSLGSLIEIQMKNKMSGLETSHIEYPQHFHHDDLAPLPFVVYRDKAIPNQKRVKCSNFYFSGTEALAQSDWTGFFERQDRILQDIVTDVVKERDKTLPSQHAEELR